MFSPLPSCAMAYKEWAGIARAVASGRQSLLLRKGGIAERDGQFRPEHDAFWLYPTATHQSEQGLRPDFDLGPAPEEPAGADAVALRTLVVVERAVRIERADRLVAFRNLHAWSDETVSARFAYRVPGLWLLLVRAFVRDEPHVVSVRPEDRGCHTWVELPAALPLGDARPALDPAEHARRAEALERALRAT